MASISLAYISLPCWYPVVTIVWSPSAVWWQNLDSKRHSMAQLSILCLACFFGQEKRLMCGRDLFGPIWPYELQPVASPHTRICRKNICWNVNSDVTQRLALWNTEYGKTIQKYFSFLWMRGVVLSGGIFPGPDLLYRAGKVNGFFPDANKNKARLLASPRAPKK